MTVLRIAILLELCESSWCHFEVTALMSFISCQSSCTGTDDMEDMSSCLDRDNYQNNITATQDIVCLVLVLILIISFYHTSIKSRFSKISGFQLINFLYSVFILVQSKQKCLPLNGSFLLRWNSYSYFIAVQRLWSRHYCVCSRVHMQAMVYWRWVPVDLSRAAVT